MRRLAALLALALVAPTAAQAAAKAPVFGLRAVGSPKLGYFVYSLAPGAVRHGAVIVSNVGTGGGTVKLYSSDGTTGPTTGTVYQTSQKPTSTGAWVSLGRSSLTLPPGGHRTVPFTVRVPANAKPGQWVAGIVAETSQKVARQKPGSKAHVQIRIRNLTIIAVQVNVPGKRVSAFTIGRVTTGGSRGFQKVFVQVANVGNVLVKPHGQVTIYGKAGNVVQSLPFTMDTFLPGTRIDYPVLLKKALRPGSYSAAVKLVVPRVAGVSAKTVTARPSFSVSNTDVEQVFSSSQPTQAAPGGAVASSSSGFPTWAYTAIAAGAVVALGLLLLWLLGRPRRPEPPGTTLYRPDDEPPPPGAEPEPEPAPEPPPAPAPAPAVAAHDHEWDVAYDRGVLGQDGVWRFPHRCRVCSVELLARDVTDASQQAR